MFQLFPSKSVLRKDLMPQAIKERSLPLPSSCWMIIQHVLTVERGQLD